MRGRPLVLLALLLIGPALLARDDPEKKDKPPAEQYQQVSQEYQKAQQDWQKEYLAAKPGTERQELLKKRPTPEPYTARMLELVEKNANDAVAFDALAWIVQTGPASKEAPKAIDALLKKHIENPGIGRVCQALSFSQVADADKLLRAGLEKNPQHEAKGIACYVLAVRLQRRAIQNNTESPNEEAEQLFDRVAADFIDVDAVRTLTLAPNSAAPVAVLRKIAANATDSNAKGQALYILAQRLKSQAERAPEADLEKLNKEVEGLLEQIEKDHAEVKCRGQTLGQLAKSDLEEIRLLGIGKPAPEIEGEDVDGKKLKLSDYKGKVVLLDFWGDW